MNEIQRVKESADILKVAQYFHLNLNKSNKCICPLRKKPEFFNI